MGMVKRKRTTDGPGAAGGGRNQTEMESWLSLGNGVAISPVWLRISCCARPRELGPPAFAGLRRGRSGAPEELGPPLAAPQPLVVPRVCIYQSIICPGVRPKRAASLEGQAYHAIFSSLRKRKPRLSCLAAAPERREVAGRRDPATPFVASQGRQRRMGVLGKYHR